MLNHFIVFLLTSLLTCLQPSTTERALEHLLCSKTQGSLELHARPLVITTLSFFSPCLHTFTFLPLWATEKFLTQHSTKASLKGSTDGKQAPKCSFNPHIADVRK